MISYKQLIPFSYKLRNNIALNEEVYEKLILDLQAIGFTYYKKSRGLQCNNIISKYIF